MADYNGIQRIYRGNKYRKLLAEFREESLEDSLYKLSNICIYATSWRTQPGLGEGPAMASGGRHGRTLDWERDPYCRVYIAWFSLAHGDWPPYIMHTCDAVWVWRMFDAGVREYVW